MERIFKKKLQGDGRDSWDVSEYEGETLVNRYMVYEDPENPPKVNLSNIDIDTLPEDQLDKLALKLKEKLNL